MKRILFWGRRSRDVAALQEELDFHLDQLREEVQAGVRLGEKEAGESAARRRLGNTTAIREAVYEIHSWAAVESFARNSRIALRTFRRHRSTYAFAIGVLAAGIAISTAVFSLVEAVLLDPLPFPDQDQIEVIQKADPRAGTGVVELAYPELGDLQQGVPAFSSVALMPTTLYGYGKVIQFGGRAPVQVESTPVSHDFFRTLGVKPAMGRDFRSGDEHVGAAPVTILSDATWRQEFGADPAITGRMIRLNGKGCEVIGVMARDVEFPRGVGLWVPLGVYPETGKRGATYLQAIARRRPGFSHEQAFTQVKATVARLQREYPQFYPPSQEAVMTTLPRYWTGSARLQLLTSLGAAFLLLLTAAITASNLFLSRALARAREVATRFSLGASAGQLWGQFAAEGATAAVIAGALGAGLAWALIRVLARLAPADIPRLGNAGLNGKVLLFALLVSGMTAVACTVAPAVMASRRNIEAVLRSGGTRLTAGRSGRRLQNAFTVGQTTVTLVLLCASILIVMSVRAMLRADVGFGHRDAVTMNVALHAREYSREQRDRFYTTLLERLRETPGMEAAGGVLLRPLEGTIGWDMKYRTVFNRERRPEELLLSNFEVITPGYFAAVGVPVIEGRDFGDKDKRDGEQTVIISQSLAKRFRDFGVTPLGERLWLGPYAGDGGMKVVGVVGDTRDRGVVTTGDNIYVPYLQSEIPVNYVVARGRMPAQAVTEAVRREVKALDPAQAVAGVATLAELVDRDTARQRFNMALLVTFGAGALLLAAAGVYSVVAESVSVKTQEIGIRMALGADRARLLRQLIAGPVAWVAAGEVIGLLGFVGVARVMAALLYAVHPNDPVVLSGATGFLLGVSVVAACVPAWQATRRGAYEALRES